MKNFYVDTPTKDMQELVSNKLEQHGYIWKTFTMPGFDMSNIGIYENQICCNFSSKSGECITYSEMLNLLKIKVQLNENYSASINKQEKTVKVACQTFSFDKIKELYEATL